MRPANRRHRPDLRAPRHRRPPARLRRRGRERHRRHLHLQPLPVRARLGGPPARTSAATTCTTACASWRSTRTTRAIKPADSFENMKKRLAENAWPFPYLHDESQKVAKAYGAKTTPDVFVFNADNRLVYRGAPDGDYEDDVQSTQSGCASDRRGAGRVNAAARPRPDRSAAASSGRQCSARSQRTRRPRSLKRRRIARVAGDLFSV